MSKLSETLSDVDSAWDTDAVVVIVANVGVGVVVSESVSTAVNVGVRTGVRVMGMCFV